MSRRLGLVLAAITLLSGFAARWRAAGWSDVWTPGCGMDPLGWLLARTANPPRTPTLNSRVE